jgi:hypothetical protein
MVNRNTPDLFPARHILKNGFYQAQNQKRPGLGLTGNNCDQVIEKKQLFLARDLPLNRI